MALDTDRLTKEAVTQGAESGPAFLAGVRGHGTLQVVRGQRHKVMEVRGTWRPDHEDADVGELERAAHAEEPVRFEGPLADPGNPGAGEVTVSCVVTSASTYTFDDALPEGSEPRTLPVFNFRPLDDGEVVNAA